MAETMETFETTQPWIIYRYGLTHDLWWPPWSSTRVLGHAKIECRCCICGDTTVLKIKMPRFGPVVDRGHHPARTKYLAEHTHPLQTRDLIAAARCLRCGAEDANAGRGGWSSCFTVCDDCWGKPVDDASVKIIQQVARDE